MKYIDGWAVPDFEKKIENVLTKIKKNEMYGKQTELKESYNEDIKLSSYQEKIRNQAVSKSKSKDVFIDVGANIGLWAAPLSLIFNKTVTFEVNTLLSEALVENVNKFGSASKTIFNNYGLANREKQVSIVSPKSNSFSTYISDKKEDEMFLVNSFDCVSHQFLNDSEQVSLVKIDTEGSEPYVLYGMVEMLIKHKPLIVIEDKNYAERYGFCDGAAVNFLKSLGAVEFERKKRDYIYGWI